MREIDRGHRVSRKPHQCFDCYRTIPKGTRHYFYTGACDGRAYTLRSHVDCHEACEEYAGHMAPGDFDDGIPPLFDMMMDSGEFQSELDLMRGHFPHVVCRMELGDLLAEIRYADFLAKALAEDAAR